MEEAAATPADVEGADARLEPGRYRRGIHVKADIVGVVDEDAAARRRGPRSDGKTLALLRSMLNPPPAR